MAKLTILAVALLVALAEASTFRTTVTTTTIEEVNPRVGNSQTCREQVQGQDLSHCERYLSEGSQTKLRLRMVANTQQQESQHLQQCCKQLENVDEQCRCEAIKQMVMQQQQQGQMQGQEMEQMEQKAKNLPNSCNMEPQQCQLLALWF